MIAGDPEYQSHHVFAELDKCVAFYKRLAHAVFPWASPGTKAFCNIDSYVFSSIQGTLSSIQMVLQDGRINDAYALLRKYNDSAIINIYSILYLEDNFSIDTFIVQQIDNWLKGRARLPRFGLMVKYIRDSTRVATITHCLSSDDRYERLRDRCNDHMHYNFYRYVLLNDKDIFVSGRVQALAQFSADLRDIFVLHIAYLFSAKQNYMMSSDHLDALECGLTPEPDSEYWVAPFVQDAFDNIVARHRPDLAAVIKGHTSMHLA